MLNMTRLLKKLKAREWAYALAALTFIIAQVWMDLKMPDYMNLITQIAQGGMDPKTGLAWGCLIYGKTAAVCCCVPLEV